MELDKERICHCFCLVFTKRNAADAHWIIRDIDVGENVIAIKMCANW